MTLLPPNNWRDGTPEQQAAYQGFKDGRNANGYNFQDWRDIGFKCLVLYNSYFDAGYSFRKQDAICQAGHLDD
jgi:hypothetical protein